MANDSSKDPILIKDINPIFNYQFFQSKIDNALRNIKSIPTNEADHFLLVSGDLSGIQNTVYTISSKGALKSLRARSFMLELLCEHCCYELVTSTFGKYETDNVVFSGGGGFCVLLPNAEKTLKTLDEFKKVINKWAFGEFGGKLYIAIDSIELRESEINADNDNEKLRKKWNELSDKLENVKKRKFYWMLDEIFSDEFIKEPTLHNNKQECQICHRDDIKFENGERLYSIPDDESTKIIKIDNPKLLAKESEDSSKMIVHELCYNLLLLGRNLKRAKNIYRYNNPSNNSAFISFPSIIRNNDVIYVLEENKYEELIHKWSINEFNTIDSTPFLFSNYDADKLFPIQAVDFKILANASMGANLVGCLRMDVDDLGKNISEQDSFNLITLSQLSFNLNYFFKVHLSKICESGTSPITSKNYTKGRAVSVVYAGGDDLFIVGAWDETAELALDIQKEFSTYFNLGISAGLTLHKHDFPFYQIAEFSLRAINTAKSKKDASNNLVKNSIALFYNDSLKIKNIILKNRIERTNRIYAREDDSNDRIYLSINWNEFLEIALITKELNIIYPKLSHGFFQKLFEVIKIWQEDGKLYMPTMNYIIRKIQVSVHDKVDVLEMLERLMTLDIEKMKSLHMPLTWVAYLNR